MNLELRANIVYTAQVGNAITFDHILTISRVETCISPRNRLTEVSRVIIPFFHLVVEIK